ncbi:MAG: hypothetical protein KGL39_10930 [Patescibacteria group bacterium]|nr:hypothetical protein [Patescibacteria group bacterium]
MLVSLAAKFILSPADCYILEHKRGVKRNYGDRVGALAKTTDAYGTLKAAVESGNVEMLDVTLPNFNEKYWINAIVDYAVEHKQLGILKKLHVRGLINTDHNIFRRVAATGDLRIVRWYRRHYGIGDAPGYAYEWAAGCGHLHVMKWIDRNLPSVVLEPRTYVWAATGNHLAVIDWLKAKGTSLPPYIFADAIAQRCSLDALKALHAVNPTMIQEWNVAVFAAGLEKADVLRWLVKDLGAPSVPGACYEAARMRRLEALSWLKENSCSCGGECHNPATIERLAAERHAALMAELD